MSQPNFVKARVLIEALALCRISRQQVRSGAIYICWSGVDQVRCVVLAEVVLEFL